MKKRRRLSHCEPHAVSFDVLQLVVTGYLVGLIWLIQLIHYPAFRHIESTSWGHFHQAHSAMLGLLAGGPMIVSLLVGLWLSYTMGTARQHVALGCEVVAWIVTFGLSVPEHARLAKGKDAMAISRLIRWNWLRTMAWTSKLAVLLIPAQRAIAS